MLKIVVMDIISNTIRSLLRLTHILDNWISNFGAIFISQSSDEERNFVISEQNNNPIKSKRRPLSSKVVIFRDSRDSSPRITSVWLFERFF